MYRIRFAKILLTVSFLAMTFALSACGSEAETPVVATPAPISTPTPTPVSTPSPTPEITSPPLEIEAANTFPFPFSFTAEDLHGNQVTAESLGEKELFFVYFWTTWCPSCVRSIPGLVDLAEEFYGRVGFITLLGDFDTAQDTAIRITEDAGASFITMNSRNDDFYDLMGLLASGFVPTSVMIGADGMVGEQIVGGNISEFRTAIERTIG